MAKRSSDANTGESSTRVLKGWPLRDPYLSRIGGFDEADELATYAHLLYTEVEHVVNQLFPYQFDSAGRMQEPKFAIRYGSNETISHILNAHMTEDRLHRSSADRHDLYPHGERLLTFLKWIGKALVTHGVSYFAVDWEPLTTQQNEVIVPTSFRYLDPSTMHIHKMQDGTRRFVQKYSPFGPPEYPVIKSRKTEFSEHEVLFVDYHFGIPPVHAAKELARKSWDVMNQITLQARASAHPDDMSYEVEQVRYISSKDLTQKRAAMRAKIRKIFKLPVESPWMQDSDATEFYKAYRYVEHLKYMIQFRSFLLGSLNMQIMKHIATINSLPEEPGLEYLGQHSSIEEIERCFEAFQKEQINYAELLATLK